MRERSVQRAPVESTVEWAQEAPVEPTEPIAVSRPHAFRGWPLQPGGREASAEVTVRPKSWLSNPTDSPATVPGPKKPSPAVSKEVIDLPSILINMEKKYRCKRLDDPKPASDANSEKVQLVTMEEIRRRLMATYGGRLSGIARRADQKPPAEPRRGTVPGAHDRYAQGPAARVFMPAGPSRVEGVVHGEAARMSPRTLNAGNGSKMPTGAVSYGPSEKPSGNAVKGAPPPVKTVTPVKPAAPSGRTLLPAGESSSAMPGASRGVPVGVVQSTEPVSREAEGAIAPVQPCKLIFKRGELLCLPAPSEGDTGGMPAQPPAMPESPAVNPAACGPVLDSLHPPCTPPAPSGPFTPEFQSNAYLPPLSLLHPPCSTVAPMSQDDLIDGGILIEEKLAEFRVKVNVQDAYAGPVITRYEIQPAVGVRGGQVVSLVKDLARALGVASIRVVETIPGKTCMGLELPNPRRQMIHLSEVLSSEVFQSHTSKLAMVLGKDIIGEPVVADLAKAPHILVAGTTGSGKSVGVNAMILSLLYRATPDEVRFLMIDPKMLELSIYDGIPHLLAPVVTDMKLAANALTWCVGEMERRYRLMSGLRVRNLAGYNQKVRDAIDAGEPLVDPLASDDLTPLTPLPCIVVVVDELADLMMVAGKKIEELIARLAQKARAAGIHLIIATQRPSVDVITGLIKANIPTRIAFQVSSKIDSRTILDQMGAECLLGQGDMLYLPPGTGYPQRVHGAFVADEEVHAVAEYLKQLGKPQYVEGVLSGMADGEEGVAEVERFGEEADPLYDDAVEFVISSRRASISAVQRHLRIGYNRAARLVEQMEASGLVSPMESNGNRTVLVPPRQE